MSRRETDLPPPLPASLDDDPSLNAAMLAAMRAHVRELRQRNLMAAVRLAQQAAGGHGPLVDHFAELGRRFGEALRVPAKPRSPTKLRVIRGDKA